MKLIEYIKKAFINLFKPVTREYVDKKIDKLASQNEKLTKELRLIRTELKEIKAENEQINRAVKNTEKNVKNRIEDTKRAIVNSKFDIERKMDEHLDPALYEHVIKEWYQNVTGELLDFENPRGYNAKVQWMKLYDPQDDLKAQLSDKILVRDYVRERTSEEYLIPLLAVYDKAEEIDFDALPQRFVLKANHGCGYNAIVIDKDSEDLEKLRYRAGKWLRQNYAFHFGYELHYEKIRRRLLAEEYIGNGKDAIPDYKFWCFDGIVHYICVIVDRDTDPRMAFYDTDWTRHHFTHAHPETEKEIPKPEKLEEMIEISEKLAEGFPHVRVDLYQLEDGTIKFGELTFTSASGASTWNPPETDLMMGELFRLPEKAERV